MSETKKSTNTLVFYFPDVDRDFQMVMSQLTLAQKISTEYGLSFVVHLDNGNRRSLLNLTKSVHASIVVSLMPLDELTTAQLQKLGIHILCLGDPKIENSWGPYEIAYQIGAAQARACFQAGYKRISFVHSQEVVAPAVIQARKIALRDVAAEHGQSYVPSIALPFDPQKRLEVFLEAVNENRDVDAYCCSRNFVAATVISFLRDMGRHIPCSAGVIGYGDDPLCEIVRPALTAATLDMESILRTLAQSINNVIDGDGSMMSLPENLVRVFYRGSLVPSR